MSKAVKAVAALIVMAVGVAGCASSGATDSQQIGSWKGGDVFPITTDLPEDRSQAVDWSRCAAARFGAIKGYEKFSEARLSWDGPKGETRSPFVIVDDVEPAFVVSPYAFFGPEGDEISESVSVSKQLADCEKG